LINKKFLVVLFNKFWCHLSNVAAVAGISSLLPLLANNAGICQCALRVLLAFFRMNQDLSLVSMQLVECTSYIQQDECTKTLYPITPPKCFTSYVESTLLMVFKLTVQILSLRILGLGGASWVLRVSR